MRLLLLLFALAQMPSPSAPTDGPCAAAEHHQFDFWIGDWDVRAANGQMLGTNHITSILGGCALQENWSSANGKVRGVSINAFDPADHRWHQEWVDTSPSRLTLTGGLVTGQMVMEQREPPSADGKVQVQRITWRPLDDGRVRQHWEVSTDGGATWKTSFDGYYARRR
jgi:hypothetical protein